MPIMLANIKFRHVDYDKAERMGMPNFEEEVFHIGDLYINDLRTYFESDKKGYLIVGMLNTSSYEIEMTLDKFRAFLKICGYTIVEEVPENVNPKQETKKEWTFAKEYIKAFSD